MPSIDRQHEHIRISLVGEEITQPTTSDVGLFIYDFASIYELARLATDPNYEYFQFSRFALYRNGRHLRQQDQLNIDRIRLESPLEVISTIAIVGGAIMGVAGAVWTITQTFEKLYNLPLSRRKLELEVQKLEREESLANRKSDSLITPEETPRLLEEREAAPYIEIVARRLSNSPIRIQKIDVELINPDDNVDSPLREEFRRWLESVNSRNQF